MKKTDRLCSFVPRNGGYSMEQDGPFLFESTHAREKRDTKTQSNRERMIHGIRMAAPTTRTLRDKAGEKEEEGGKHSRANVRL